MRLLFVLLAMPLLIGHAYAQPASPPPAPHQRMTLEQRFAQANTSHDGHLTLEQAKASFPSVARHFTDIDNGNKGYVTEEDIRAWRKHQRESRSAHPANSSSLPPRAAVLGMFPAPRQFNTVTTAPALPVSGGLPRHTPDLPQTQSRS